MAKRKKPKSGRHQRGRRMLKKIHGRRGTDAIDSMEDIAPDFCRFVYEFPFADIYARPGLDLKSRQLVTVSILAALGNAAPQLKAHLFGSLNVGLTRKQLIETLLQVSVYAGFPATLNALKIAREVFEELDGKKPAVRKKARKS